MEKPVPKNDNLPQWDLAKMLGAGDDASFDDAALSVTLEQLFDDLEVMIEQFSARYKGRMGKLSGIDLGRAIVLYEDFSEKAGVLHTYFRLRLSQDDRQRLSAEEGLERLSTLTKNANFFTSDIRKMKESDLLSRMGAPELARYSVWIGKVRAARDYSFPTGASTYLSQKDEVSFSAWRRLIEEEKKAILVKHDNKEISVAAAFSKAVKGETAEARAKAYAVAMAGLADNKDFFALATNTLVDLQSTRDDLRGFDQAQDFRHHSNNMDGDIIEAMAKDVRESYGKLAHRYFAWKADKNDVARLHPTDRVSGIDGRNAEKISWAVAKDTVLAAFTDFSPEMAKMAEGFFDGGYIDAQPSAHKRGGAFSHPSTPTTHPFILMSFTGAPSNVRTLMHELGHGVHQMYTAKEQGYLMQRTALPLSETASTFAEGLLYRHLIAKETDLVKKRALMAERIENMLNMALFQTAVYTYETKVHSERIEKGPLPPERISALWLETQKECFGYPVDFDVKGAENEWMLRHRIRRPFYSYAYAFGECLSAALLDQYDKAKDKDAFVKKYKNFLKTAGTKPLETLLDDFDMDTENNPFWRRGLAVISGEMEALFALDRQIEALKNPMSKTAPPVAAPKIKRRPKG